MLAAGLGTHNPISILLLTVTEHTVLQLPRLTVGNFCRH